MRSVNDDDAAAETAAAAVAAAAVGDGDGEHAPEPVFCGPAHPLPMWHDLCEV